MSNRSKAAGRGVAGRRCRGGRSATALTALLFSFTLVAVSGEVRAEVIVLKSGEVVEGSIIEATRNTVIVQRTIGGMRQMPIQDIREVRFDLAQGLRFAGEFLGWGDGVYEVRSGDQIIRISESGILSREPSQQTARLLPTRPPVQQQSTAAAAPSTTERAAVPASERQNRSRAAAGQGSNAAAADAQRAAADQAERLGDDAQAQAAVMPQPQGSDTEERTAAAPERQASDAEAEAAAVPQRQTSNAATQAAAVPQRESSDEAPAETASRKQAAAKAGDQAAAQRQSSAAAAAQRAAADDVERQSEPAAAAKNLAAADPQKPAAAGKQVAAVGDQGILAVKASVDPPEPGARSMVFNIELSQPAKQTIVLIYGTVDGTAKAGEDYEAQQGMVTVAPGARSAEVRVPLIEGTPEDGEKRFELVLMADPKVAQVVDRRVIATINGGD
jgi:Calx-beta domain